MAKRRDDDIAQNAERELCERIGRNLTARRAKSRLTQANVAEQVGCSVALVSAAERGSRSLSLRQIALFASALGCAADELLSAGITAGAEGHEVIALYRAVPDDLKPVAMNLLRVLVHSRL